MRKTLAFLGSFVMFAAGGCAATPPPSDNTAGEGAAATIEPAPPADPPPPEAASPPPASPAPTPPEPSGTSYAGPSPCKLAVKGHSPVAEACRDGGVKEAKSVMKDLVRRAKENGVRFVCDDCHKNPEDFTKLAADAPEKFKKLLAAAR